jgi:hypothetical protein
VQRAGLRYVLEGQVVRQVRPVDRRVAPPALGQEGQQGLLLAGEVDTVVGDQVVEGLDAVRVPRAERPLRQPVPDDESEHAAQPVDRARAPVVVGRHDHLGVAGGGELSAVLAGQLLPQLDVVVDLPVEGDHVPTEMPVGRWVRQRLMAVLHVDDGQAFEAEDRVVTDDCDAGLVRSPVVDPFQRLGDRIPVDGGPTISTDEGEQSAHVRHLVTGYGR